MPETSTTLYADYAALAGAAEVADRQVTHLGDVGRYLGEVCGRTEAFRGFLLPFAGTYGDAVASAVDGVGGGAAAARRWATATRDTADGLGTADLVVRRGLDRLLTLLAGDVPHPTATAFPPPASACSATSARPVGLGSPEVAESPVPLGEWSRWEADLPRDLRPLDQGGDLGLLAGQGVQALRDAATLADGVPALGDSWSEVGDAGDDLTRYDEFLAEAS